MSIIVDEGKKTFTLETRSTAYQMKVDEHGTLLHTWYGKKLSDDDLSYAILRKDRGLSGNPHDVGLYDRTYSLDLLPQEIACYGAGDYRISTLRVQYENGASALSLTYDSYEILKEKYDIPDLPASYSYDRNDKTLVVRLKDVEADILVELYYGVFEEKDVITRAVRVCNLSDQAIKLLNAGSMTLDFNGGDFDILTFYGKWAGERQVQRTKLQHGVFSIGSVRGASSPHYNPSCILCSEDTNEDRGEAYGLAFVYSGEFLLACEKDGIDQTRLSLGIHPDNFSWELLKDESFMSPEVILTYTENGFSGISHAFHDFIRDNIVRGAWQHMRRPVLINNWEGTYFNFNGEKLIRFAEEARDLGIELFVLDDGWFGNRNDDNAGLGDWVPNEKKLGMTMEELGLCIKSTGVSFGIWFEPEMVNEDSDLFREHPQWAVSIPDRKPNLSRNQLVLDVSRRDVQDYLIDHIEAVLAAGDISYLKWDFNRSLCDKFTRALPRERQGEMAHMFVMGTYRILEHLIHDFPNLLIEGCSSGGGRFDCGMLYYTPQIWTSDNTDPIERLSIQYGTSFIYPVSAMGAHVSASPNHQTGRETPFKTRTVIAMSGAFGYELDPEKLSSEEKAMIRKDAELYKEIADTLLYEDYYRLLPPTHPEAAAWEQVTKDGRRAIVSAVWHHVRANMAPVYIKLRGLKGFAHYRITFAEGHSPESLSRLTDTQQKIFKGEIHLKGDTLMNVGLFLPEPVREFDSMMFMVERI